ncbi:MAG: hypothetical protein MUC72_03370 [Acidobacteria bacterium]|jgi:hypothetical protein|nr:hypothetical protein [Acidobacteriota bacterium]
MGVYLSKRADHVKLYLALWLVAFMGLWVNFFREFSEPFRVGTISYFLAYLAAFVGGYFILAPLLQGRAITAEKNKGLPFLPALLLLLHWLFQQLDLMFTAGGRVVLFSFSILVNPLFVLFLFLGLVLYLLAAQPQIMDAVFVGMKNTIRLFVAVAFLALGLVSLAQVIQAVSALAKIGVDSGAWANYSRLGVFTTGGLIVSLLLNLLLLLVPLCGWVLLQKLLGKATPKWDRLLRLPWRWLGALPLVLIALAILAQPETFYQPWFVITALISFISILVNFLAASQNPVAVGIVKLAESYFFYPYRYFRKIVQFGRKDMEVTENENAGIDYFCHAIKGFICIAILAFWVLLAVYPILRYYGLNFLPLPLQPEIFPVDSFQGLLLYPLVYFIYPPLYAVVITLFYEVVVVLLQILVRVSKFLGKLLERN